MYDGEAQIDGRGDGVLSEGRPQGRPDGWEDQGEQADAGAAPCDSKEGSPGTVEKEGRIYFIETHDGAFIKIGYSINVPRRLESLGVQMPGLKLIGSMPGTFATERWLHDKFVAYRERGEWFKRSPELAAFIWNIGLSSPTPFEVPPRPKGAVVQVSTEGPAGTDEARGGYGSRALWECSECGQSGYSRISPKGGSASLLKGIGETHGERSPGCSGNSIVLRLDANTIGTANRMLEDYRDFKAKEREEAESCEDQKVGSDVL